MHLSITHSRTMSERPEKSRSEEVIKEMRKHCMRKFYIVTQSCIYGKILMEDMGKCL